MNLRKRYCILAASAVFALTGLNSCKDYSKDDPLPVTYGQTLFVASDNQIVYALDPISLEKKWKFSANASIESTPLVYNKVVYLGTTAGTLYALDAQTGTIITSATFANPIIGTPILRGDMLLVVEGTKIHALNLSTLANYYQPPSTNPSDYDLGGTILASPAIHNIAGGAQKAIFIAGMNNQVVALNDVLTPIWTFTAPEAGSFYSSPCVVNDSFVYIGNDNGNVYAINSVDGTQKWSFKTGAQVRSSPIQIGGNVLVGSNDRNFYSVDSATGLLRWKVQTGDAIQSSPVVFNQNVYFGSYDTKFYCVDIIDGKVKWNVPTQALIKSSPVYFNGDIYFGGFDKLLYRLDAMTGAQRVNPYNINGQMATSPVIDAVSKVYVPSISGDYSY